MSDTKLEKTIAEIKDDTVRSILAGQTSEGKLFANAYVDGARQKLARSWVSMERRLQESEKAIENCSQILDQAGISI